MTDLRKAAEMLMKALDDGWVERDDICEIAKAIRARSKHD